MSQYTWTEDRLELIRVMIHNVINCGTQDHPDVAWLNEAVRDHNKVKCRGKHCRECAIQPSFKHLYEKGLIQDSKIRFILNTENTDAKAAVPNYIDTTTTKVINCTGDMHCPICPEYVRRDLHHEPYRSIRNRPGGGRTS